MERTVLCYGDSNTWGYVPTDFSDGNFTIQRFTRNNRWTGLLQKHLGENFYVIEEGLNSRTTNLDYQYPPDRNGKTYLPSCLYSHAPVDLVVLALGGNDLKSYFNRSPKDIRDGLADLISIIQDSMYGEKMLKAPDILIVSPFKILPIAEHFKDESGEIILPNAIQRSEELVHEYSALAKEKGCHFLDVSASIVSSKIDGVHLDADAHQKLALIMSDKIKSIFYEKNKDQYHRR